MRKVGQKTKFDEKVQDWRPRKPGDPKPEHMPPPRKPEQFLLFPENDWEKFEFVDPEPKPLDLEYPALNEENVTTENFRYDDKRQVDRELEDYVNRSKAPEYYSRSRVKDQEEAQKLKQYFKDNKTVDLVKGRVLAKYEELRQKTVEFYAKYKEANNLAEQEYKININGTYEEFFRDFAKLLVVEISKEIGILFGHYVDRGLITSLREGVNVFNITSLNFERTIEQMNSMINAMNHIILEYDSRKKILNQLGKKVDAEAEEFLSNPHWLEFLRWMDEYFPDHKQQFADHAIDVAKKTSGDPGGISFSSLVRFKTYKSIYENAQSAATLGFKQKIKYSIHSEILNELKSQIRKRIRSRAINIRNFILSLDDTDAEAKVHALINYCKRTYNIDLRAIYTFATNAIKKRNEWFYEPAGTSDHAMQENVDRIARANRKFIDSFISNVPSTLEIYLSLDGLSLGNEVDSFIREIGEKFNHFSNKEDLEKVLKFNTKDLDHFADLFIHSRLVYSMPGFQNKYESVDESGYTPTFGGIRSVMEETDGKFSIESFTNFAHSKLPFIPKEILLTTIRSFFKDLDYRSLNLVFSLNGSNAQNTGKFFANILNRDNKLEFNSFVKLFKNIDTYQRKFSIFKSGLPKNCTEEDVIDIMTLAVKHTNTIDKNLDNLGDFIKLIHDEAGELSGEIIKKIISNKNFNNFNKIGIVKKVIRAYAHIKNNLGVKYIFKRYGPMITDLKRRKFLSSNFKENLITIEKFFESNHDISPASANFPQLFEAASKVESDLSVLEMGDALQDLLKDYKPKDKNLFKLNLQLRNDIRFRVLADKDPRILRIGIETSCCQRIGGAGEAAARDSFMNPLASVLILEWKDPESDEWKLLSQSYFHYVPKDNGYILDNVEHNPENERKFNDSTHLSLDELYTLYAQDIKRKLNVSYFLAGKAYSSIAANKFKTDKRSKDPRSFDERSVTRRYPTHYTDYSETGSIDLLAPKLNLNKIKSKISQARLELRNIVKAILNPANFIKFAQQPTTPTPTVVTPPAIKIEDIRSMPGVKVQLFGPQSWEFVNQFMNALNASLFNLGQGQKLGNQTINFQTVTKNPSGETRFTGGLKGLFLLATDLWSTVTVDREVYSVVEAQQIVDRLLTLTNSLDIQEPAHQSVKPKLVNILNNWSAILK